MATTSPDLIYSPDNTAGIDQLHTELATMAASVQTAFDTRVIKTYKWADNAARTAQTGMVAGDEGYQTDTDTAYRYDGTAWKKTALSSGVIPSSIVVGSGSASVDAFGLVTFTAVSSVSLNDIFDGLGGDVYEISGVAKSSTGSFVFSRLRSGGVDAGGTTYDRATIFTRIAGPPSTSSATNDDMFGWWGLTNGGSGPADFTATTQRIMQPVSASNTFMTTTVSQRYNVRTNLRF